MERPTPVEMTVQAQVAVPIATAQVVQFTMIDPSDTVMQRRNGYWLDLCLTPRPLNTRACYREHWGPHRFERLGDMFLVPPGEAIHVRGDSAGLQSSIICELHADAINKWLGTEIDWNDRRLEASLDISSNTIRHLLRRLAEEARNPGLGSPMLVECIAGQLAIELGRYCEAVVDAPVSGGLAAWRLRIIDERLREVREPPTLGELAALCNISVRQLTRGFRASRGCSIGEYVVQSRIESAKRLLDRDESVKAIAYSIGFSSTSSFSYAFRRATGLTPRQFRQRVLQRMRH
ncbi:MAG TPA: helix-turn-helix transcriptional regulator [Sphingobium sp.]|uniref:helix-turn-helix transcriptional regulator n=1 Tax=Sphingobium sp. TaxID=1912891 RepID=UPI002ED3E089